MLTSTASKTKRPTPKQEAQKYKTWILMSMQLGIVVALTLFIFKRKNNLAQMGTEEALVGKVQEIFEQINDEVEECLRYSTRKEQNTAFANIDTIEKTKPLRMTESTAVFMYEGAIGGVGEAALAKKKNAVIIKRIILKKENKPEEEEISLKVDHKNLMKTYLSYKTKFKNQEGKEQDILWLLMEPLEHKITVKDIDRNEEVIRTIMKDVLNGLSYLHENGIAHLDLKLANVMGDYSEEEGRVVYKIIDFGFSRHIQADKKEKLFEGRSYGTFPYKPPEIWKKSIHGFTSDIWCLGMMGVFAANKDTTYFQKKDAKKNENNKDTEKFKNFIEGVQRVPIYEKTSPELVDFLHRCVRRNRESRWSVEQLLAHPFIAGKKLSKEDADRVQHKYYV